MLKSTIKKSEYKAIYRLLDRVSPVSYDCGTLCGAVCCGTPEAESRWQQEDDALEMGIYLLPGEEKIHDRNDDWLTWSTEDAEDYDFPESWHGRVFFVRCKNPPHCPREKRPIQCRTFPLAPHITEGGRLVLIMNDVELPYVCPLIKDRIPLNESFMKATYTCWKHLITDPLIRDLVFMDSLDRRYGESGREIEIIYEPDRP